MKTRETVTIHQTAGPDALLLPVAEAVPPDFGTRPIREVRTSDLYSYGARAIDGSMAAYHPKGNPACGFSKESASRTHA